MPSTVEITPPETPNFMPKLYGIALIVFTIVMVGVFLVSRYAAMDEARDLHTWQEKLNLIAESRATDVNQWVSENFKELHTLADNPSLQLYMTELQMSEPSAPGASVSEEEPAQTSYLRNLLLFTASRAGFGDQKTAPAIPANLPTEGKNALVIVNGAGEIVVSTPMSDMTRKIVMERGIAKAEEGIIDISEDSDGVPYIGFVVPVYSIQGDRDSASQIGRVIGIKAIDGNLFNILKHPGTTEKTLETVLVREDGAQLEYISPLQDGTKTLGKKIEIQPEKLAEATLVKETGNFISRLNDYRNKPVLATSRSIADTPWTMVVKIDRQEALADSNQRRASMVTFFLLVIALIVLVIIAIWRHAFSKRAILMSEHFKALAERAIAQEKLLRLVADNQPESIYLLDNKYKVHFANQQAALEAGSSLDGVTGKTLEDVRGATRAIYIKDQCEKALQENDITYDVQKTEQDSNSRVIRSIYVPLDHIPVASLPKPTPGLLVVEQDISEVVHERERRLETQRQLVSMLVKLVDKRDPFAANHSQLVAQVAQEVAMDMSLDNITVETSLTAGMLMNIGKIVVPPELLTKTESLSTEEKRVIRESMNMASDLIKKIHFDGPVSETLRQWQEKWDGSGPLGLKGENILISARIVATANAFVGMVSPRSWRTAMSMEAATKFLIEQSDTYFDRRVVIALINYVENHSGRTLIKKILDSQKD